MTTKSVLVIKLRELVFAESGGALAELALMVPFLAVMLAGVAEFGRFFQNYTTLAKSTRTAARYLSNHELNATEVGRATNLAVCGKLACAGGDELVSGLTAGNICLESAGSPTVTSVTVRIPRVAGDCTPMPNSNDAAPFVYQPIFDIGALLQSNTFTLALPISPSTTMYYMVE